MSDETPQPGSHIQMIGLWCRCVKCERRFIIDAVDAMMVSCCPFCKESVDYTPMMGAPERVQ